MEETAVKKNRRLLKNWSVINPSNSICLTRIIILIFLMLWFSYWAFKISFNQAPDEYMRYLIPTYIFNHGKLPTGYDEGAIYVLGNWSYAFYPQFLGPIISATFMKLFSFFTHSYSLILFVARLSSVLFGGITLYFTGKSISTITKNQTSGLFGMILLGLTPQFTYLSAYVNNDIVATAGVAIISYAVLESVYNRWKFKNSLLLAFGFLVCGLGYLNSYGFILMGGIFFLFIQFYQIKKGVSDWKNFWKQFSFIFLFVMLLVVPFFIRNYLLYEDFFGMKIFNEVFIQWQKDNPNWMVEYPSLLMRKPFDGNMLDLFRNQDFITNTRRSLVGVFSYMSIFMKDNYYFIYNSIFGAGSICFILRLLFPSTTVKSSKIKARVAFACLLLGSLITCGLFLYYVLNTDFQPQGRYIFSISTVFIIFVVTGFDRFLDLIVRKTPYTRQIIYLLLSVVLIYLSYQVYNIYITQTFIPSNVTVEIIKLVFE